MHSSIASFQWLLYIFTVISSLQVSATRFNIPRLSPTRGTILQNPEILSATISEDFQTFYYNQTLDHFNYRPESYSTFQQRYVINFKYWGGGAGADANAPIFVYLGAEGPLDGDISIIGFLTDNAARFNALLVYIEHRYYGKSIPFGSREEALKNASTLGYFNSAQAVTDYAEILLYIKEKFNARHSPVIVIGGSYGGMLATWFRLKYPHVALGALASSAPILYFDDITPRNGYYSIVTRDFREASETCYETIMKSWAEIEKVASKPDGLSILSKKFRTYFVVLQNFFNMLCGGIDGAALGTDNDILSKIFAGVVAHEGNMSCYVNPPTIESETTVGWRWQTCSEMVIPIGTDNTTMFQPAPFNLSSFIDGCESLYGVSPRPHWVTAYYGGYDIKLILQRFASNIIFSNGLRDPYSSGGVLENISDSVVAIATINGSHCLDILRANQSSDPDWLVTQRETEIEIIEGWISKYYADLKAIK
ncbi:prolylcarboxypeptidase-like protein [Citrus sinensis]|uniref:Prolylcarboxypeptidase-like protein n=1 Tax=Citrus sinensis TaxID=2711 RepID=A0ACB8ITM3_CITSI|nr:prolylcarboxypeptidase-like protein [Citrus sinensis]